MANTQNSTYSKAEEKKISEAKDKEIPMTLIPYRNSNGRMNLRRSDTFASPLTTAPQPMV